MTTRDASGVESLTTAECSRLLASHRVGRIAFAHEAWPLILPVNYHYDDPNIVIRTGPGAKLDSAPLSAIAFEIDGYDPDGAWGWSVVVQGFGFDISDALDERSERLRLAPLVAWAPGERAHWLKITPSKVTGRRFGAAPPLGG